MILNLDFQLVFNYNLSHYFFKIVFKLKITSDRQNDRHCDITKVCYAVIIYIYTNTIIKNSLHGSHDSKL